MNYRLAWIGVALSGFVMVAAGAFGAHGLRDQLTPQLLDTFETGVRYQAWHTLAMLTVLVWRVNAPLKGQGLVLGLWAVGILLFSGSLYLLALTGIRGLGIVTPFGGLAFLAGWLALAVCAARARPGVSD
ncbi:DUF423 domain-containing protein [Pistricoccus aurantiacus]|uniref:DUF423 domain-containing protein n=1 Tax=Pistricoccus aurantiacus TaxID=1883414 RepID=A0A5B8SV05_9GAMM|nr:DUF423 domain-containing protein [Pistricoccus aurantiacus]QEA38478.1 DUF423 domain-containing protein [Pistricoccus aurantiacus]